MKCEPATSSSSEPPTPEELADWAELERIQRECKHSHAPKDLDPEDGCHNCGYYAK